VRRADGPSLRLDAGTRVRFQAGVLYLETGAVYVDTASLAGTATATAKKTIKIQTGFAEIQDVGTQFEVRLDSAAAQPLSVRVREGHVDFKRGTDKVAVAAGEELTSAATGQFIARKISPADPLWDWAASCAPAFPLEGHSLESAVAWICREQGWNLKFDSESAHTAAKTIRLHGSLEGVSPKKALDAVLPASGMTYALDGATLHIKQ
jgi:ferric-dicitrate binding protein FerR (iron transport regulator)